MEKLTQYRRAIRDLLETYAQFKPSNVPNVENQVIVDPEETHFVLISFGFEGNYFHYGVVMHFDLKDGKIWVQANNTEWEVGEELMQRGVARADIVPGFQPKAYRTYSGYGVG